MDISSIIEKSLNETTEEFRDNPRIGMSSSCEKECVKAHMISRTYSNNLLNNYHNALVKELSNKGINL